jgi:hypothetical protein
MLRYRFDRFNANADVAAALKDERFVRMWLYYLGSSEQWFRRGPQDVYQLHLCRKAGAVLMTQDYRYAHAAQNSQQGIKNRCVTAAPPVHFISITVAIASDL